MINIDSTTPLQWHVEYNYDNDTSNCQCSPDYCRCGVISNARVTKISPSHARSLVDEFVDGNEVERLLAFLFFRHCLDADSFYVATCGGYYGEEVDGVTLDSNQVGHFNTLIADNDIHAILAMILTHHYGYVLPDILDYKEWEIRTVSPKDIYVPKAGAQQVTDVGYENWDDAGLPSYYPGCIVIPCCDDKLKIIDGFHRWTNFNSKKKRRRVKVLAPVVDKNNS